MNNKQILILVILILAFNSCAVHNLKQELNGNWSMEYLLYKNQYYLNNLYAYAFSLDENDKCWLPSDSRQKSRLKTENDGEWEVKIEEGKRYLNIKAEGNDIFDGLFEIKNIYMLHDTVKNGYIIKMQLESDSTYIRCVRSILFGYNFSKRLPIVRGQHVFGQEDVIEGR